MRAVELRDTLVPGFLCKITPVRRRVFMVQHRTNAANAADPALSLYGELTVGQALNYKSRLRNTRIAPAIETAAMIATGRVWV